MILPVTCVLQFSFFAPFADEPVESGVEVVLLLRSGTVIEVFIFDTSYEIKDLARCACEERWEPGTGDVDIFAVLRWMFSSSIQ